MKVLNDNIKEMELFFNKKGKMDGFAGHIAVYDESLYVNTRSGKGYDKLLTKLDKFISYLAAKYNFKGFSFEDNRQQIALHILEGISKFNPQKGTKFSSFIQMRVSRRLINDIRDEHRYSKDATILNVRSYTYVCSCNCRTTVSIPVGKETNESCVNCSRLLRDAKRTSSNAHELPIGAFQFKSKHSRGVKKNQNHVFHNFDFSPENDLLQIINYRPSPAKAVISAHDIQKWLKSEDPSLAKIINLMYTCDYTIKDAAQEVGMTVAAASVKLKRIKNKQIVKEIFGRE